jgi:hypothetical protein
MGSSSVIFGHLIGASANLMAGIAERSGLRFIFLTFTKYSLAVMFISIGISNLYLGLCNLQRSWCMIERQSNGGTHVKRRTLITAGGVGLVAAPFAAPAIAQSQPEIKWRLAASWPKSLDTLYGSPEYLAKRVAEATARFRSA